jgi:hypothetical protein
VGNSRTLGTLASRHGGMRAADGAETLSSPDLTLDFGPWTLDYFLPFHRLPSTTSAKNKKTYRKLFPATPSPTMKSNPKNPKNHPKIKKFRPLQLLNSLTHNSKTDRDFPITTRVFFHSALRTRLKVETVSHFNQCAFFNSISSTGNFASADLFRRNNRKPSRVLSRGTGPKVCPQFLAQQGG